MKLRPLARAYIMSLAALAAALLLGGLHDWRGMTGQREALALAFAALMTLAYTFPLHFAHKTKMALDTSVIFAAVLLFQPGVAMLVVCAGATLGQLIRRQPAVQIVFNAAQTTLQAGLATSLLASAGWRHDGMQFGNPDQVGMIMLAAGLMYAVNTLSVAWVVGLQTGLAPRRVWRRTAAFGGVEDVSQFALGLLAAVVVDVHAWTLPLLVLPAFVVYLALERHIRMRQQTLDAVESLADIVDLRDPYTADHSRRVAGYARELATALGLAPDEVEAVVLAARVHDIGKIVVDHEVLTKDGRLSAGEWEQLRRHPETGAEVLGNFPQFLLATEFVRRHHERIDGEGYPDGLRGDQIPLGARIIAVADALDSMATARPFRHALPPELVLGEFRRGRGSQWDARVVDALFALLDDGRLALPEPAADAPDAEAFRNLLPFPSVA